MTILPGIRYCAQSDVGARRANEDAFFADTAGRLHVFAVADGLGGHAGGRTASAMAIAALKDAIRSGAGRSDPPLLLREVFKRANSDILAYNLERGLNAGTTLVAAVIDRQNRCCIANTGDSRAYIVTDDSIWHTTDHSIVQNLIDQGIIDADQAMMHPQKNILTEALGLSGQFRIDIDDRSAEDAILLLSSDGLHGYVQDTRLLQILRSAEPDEACAALIAEAKRAGSTDNITVIVARTAPPR
ncbi:MAG: protein phosphatase 2C domain-containing protein [Methanomicrobiaceae archaeon]|nr:protein phosphatase 2C domain-containing protein [Methanomicrobiaceae archaeon]